MITNERQYKITKAQLDKLIGALKAHDLKEAAKRLDSIQLARAESDAIKSEIENLALQLQDYDALKSGKIETLKASSLKELPIILIRARIAKGLTQLKLAELLGLKEQQIQRYESEEYATANLSRLAEVAKALELNISEVAELRKTEKPINIKGLDWSRFPVKEMYYRNWFEGFSGSLSEAIENSNELLIEFLGESLNKPIYSFAHQRMRLGGSVDPYGIMVWHCRVINLAKKIKTTKSFNKSSLTNEWFKKLLKLSCETDGPKKAISYLLDTGIRLVIVPHLSKTYLDGAAILLSDGPVIGMTLRYDKLSNFWFVLIHELVHVKRHLRRGDIESIFDDLDNEGVDIEKEADEDASEILIPKKEWEAALPRYVRSEESVKEFAKKIGVNQAIVAGKIQKEANNYIILKDMVGQGEVRKLFPEVDFSY